MQSLMKRMTGAELLLMRILEIGAVEDVEAELDRRARCPGLQDPVPTMRNERTSDAADSAA